MTPGHVPTDVIEWLHQTRIDDMPDHVVHFGKRCLLDLIGVAAAGRTTTLSGIIHEHAVTHFGAGRIGAPIMFDGRRVSPGGAALAGAMTIDSIDAHDGHKITKGHTGCHQLPTLLAFTCALGLDDPRAFLGNLIVGYEFATRAGIALHATAPDYHTSGAWGAVGCAALGARLLELGEQRTFEAMGIAEYHGPRSQMMRVIDHPTMLKDGSGWGAMSGVSAAYLAADGFTGAPAVTVNDPATGDIWADLGQNWIIEEQYFKPYPVCRWAQPAVEAVLTLRHAQGLDPRQVERIEVRTFHEAARLVTALPATTEHAQYSLPFPVSAAMVRGQLGAAEVTEDALGDPEIRSLATRVSIVEDDQHNEAFPQNRYARVTIRMRTGETFTSADHEPRGDPEDHLSDDEIHAKFHAFADPVLGEQRASSIEAAVDEIDRGHSLVELVELLHAPL
ncbi:MAG: 2-methylcitrate dehydratase PrpD [Verrucomicrobiales bacterium]|jgi:2-methylcitrate dehydratase PrpD